MSGKIVKGISGFYYVHIAGSGIYECKAKGIFRNRQIRPLVGDDVAITILDEREKKGNIEQILPRKNELVRPAVANIDMALAIVAAAEPKPDFHLLDRFLVTMEYQGVPAAICINKMDLIGAEALQALAGIYAACGCQVLCVSAKEGWGIPELRAILAGKTTAVAGPSGAGKSSLVNRLQTERQMETGEVSRKIARGRHTTRHSEIIPAGCAAYIVDTPGFSALELPDFPKEELGRYYREFAQYETACRFRGCSHISEPDCGVKAALGAGISPLRYENYKLLYEELCRVRHY